MKHKDQIFKVATRGSVRIAPVLSEGRTVRGTPGDDCTGQCHGCAYKIGAAANQEGDNYLRSVFAALGGYPFFCHESLGWKGEREGYPRGSTQALVILSNRGVFVKAGADPNLIEKQVNAVRRNMRACGGWKAAVARLKSLGWFSRPEITLVRRNFAKRAAACLERLTKNPEAVMPDDRRDKERDIQDISEALNWFFNEAKDAGIKIGWLLR